MRKSRLAVKNIFGIGDLEIDFPENGLIAIQGENGAGKSSILDSLSVAMFGEPTPARAVKNADILSRSASEGLVSLSFEWGNKKYRVDREFKRTKKNAVNHKAFLYRILPLGEEEGMATGPDAVSEEISRIISGGTVGREGSELVRIVKSAWLSSVFLPQGEITRILKMKPSERREIISALFGLEEGGVLKDRSRELFSIAEEEMRTLVAGERALSSSLEEHPVSSLEDAGRKESKLSSMIAGTEKELGELRSLLEVLSSLVSIMEDRRSNKTRLDECERSLVALMRSFTLSEGRRRLDAIRESGRRVSGILSGIPAIERHIKDTENAVSEKEKNLEALRSKRGELQTALDDARKKASHASSVRTIRELRTTFSGILADAAKKKEELARLRALRAALKHVRSETERNALKKAVAEIEGKLASVSEKVRTLGESLKDRLVDWIELLGDGSGMVSVDDVRRMDPVSFARSLESSGFAALLSGMSRAGMDEETLKASLSEKRKALDEMVSSGTRDMDCGDARKEDVLQAIEDIQSLAPEKMDSRLAETEKKTIGMESEIFGLEKTSSELKEKGITLKKELGDGFDEDECLKAEALATEIEKKAGSCSMEIERISSEKGRLEVRLAELAGKRELSVSSLSAAKNGASELFASWKAVVSGWTAADYRDMEGIEKYVSAEMVEGKKAETASLKKTVKELEKRETELRKKGMFPLEPEYVAEKQKEVSDRVSELDSERTRCVSEIASLRRDMDSFRKLSARLASVRREKKDILPAYERARTLAKLLEGNGFGNFLQDRALSILLDYVNSGLRGSERYSGYSFASSGGAISVTDGSGTRDISSLSGGEATMAALLLLRGMQAVSGIGGMMAIDEGFAQLDTKNLEDAVSVLSALSSDSLIIAITHDPDFAREFDTVWKVEKGGTVTVGSREGPAESGPRMTM